MLKIQQVKRLALQNAQGSQAEGVAPGRRQSGGLGSADLSAGVAFGALEVVWGGSVCRQA